MTEIEILKERIAELENVLNAFLRAPAVHGMGRLVAVFVPEDAIASADKALRKTATL